jgi:lysine-ketoglutarate reductase/saccharopine dehydrogenase-like protein (TIGR00300 family)
VDLTTGKSLEGGHRHHMRAINAICKAGGLRQAVEQGVLASGVMYECVKHDVPFVLAGSIRDDGPLPDTIMDLCAAQDAYAAALDGVQLVLALSTMLHGIGVGNMLPSAVKMVCVDINPSVVTKLADRGSSQTMGIVTDVGLFLHRLASALKN